MRNLKTRLPALALLAALLLFDRSASANPRPDINEAVRSEGKFAAANSANAQNHPVPVGARLMTVPALEPGKKAWVSIYDSAGRALSGVSLMVNGVPHDSDAMGQVTFDVPPDRTLSLWLTTAEGKDIERTEYFLTPAGYFTAQPELSAAMDQLEAAVETKETAPMVAYAPAVIETSQPFIVIGKNLSGLPEADRIVLDGYDTDVFAGSTISLLATAPKRISLGPLRELYVTSHGESSNLMEVDICKVEIALPSMKNEPAVLHVIGTNVPALVQLQNSEPNTISLELGGRTLGTNSSFLTPGGDNNRIVLGLRGATKDGASLLTHLCSDAPWCPMEDRSIFGDSNFKGIVAALNKAEIVRLRRRLIAVEQKMDEARTKRTAQLSSGGLAPSELDRMNAEMRSLASRQARITGTISSRRAVFASLGGTDAQYREALEEASSGTTFSLEKQLAPIAAAALLVSTNAAKLANSQNDRRADGEAGQFLSAEELQTQQKDVSKSMAALSQMWKKFPIKQAHAGRLAAPPEPYMPSLSQVYAATPLNISQYARLHSPPPPPILLTLQAKSARNGKAPADRHAAKKAHRSKHRAHK